MYEELMFATQFVLEIFIHAKTKYNDSSSRALKTMSFMIEKKTFRLKAVALTVDLLEKKIIMENNSLENSFFIFYLLSIVLPESLKNEFKLKSSFFDELKCEKLSNTVFDFQNKDYYKLMLDSFQVLGFNLEEIKSMFKLLLSIIILDLERSEENLKYLQEFLGISSQIIEIIFPNKSIFQMWLYSKIFKWVLKKINIAFITQINPGSPLLENMNFFKKHFEENLKMKNSNSEFGFLHLIDTLGLNPRIKEKDKNEIHLHGYYDFKINYVFEKFHQIFLKENFKDEEVNFLQEGLIKYCDFINFKDNLPIIEIIEKPNYGIFSFFVEQLQKERRNFDEKDLEQIMGRDNNDVFFTGKMTKKERTFVITHTFSDVYYSVDFILSELEMSKNKDKISEIWIKELLGQSTNKIISKIIEDKKKISKRNFIEDFEIKIDNLLNSINSSQKRFIFCFDVEKNTENIPSKIKFNAFTCLYQSQIFEINNLIVRYKEDYPIKKDYPKFYQEFKDLLGNASEVFMKEKVLDLKNLSEKIIRAHFLEALNTKILLGKNQIYLKSDIYLKLDGKKMTVISKKNSLKQENFFSSPQFKINLKLSIYGLKQVMNVVIRFQKRFKARRARKHFIEKKKSLMLMLKFQDRCSLKYYFKKYRAQVLNIVLKNQKLKKMIRILQISKISFIRFYFLKYYEVVKFERIYSNKKIPEKKTSFYTKRSSKVIQSDAILRQIEREKTIDFKKNSIIIVQQQNTEMSLGKLLKNKLLKTMENKSIFKRLTKKKTDPLNSSNFSMEDSFEPPPVFEETKSDTSVSNDTNNGVVVELLESGNFTQKRRKCLTAKSLNEYEDKIGKSILEDYLEYKSKKEPFDVDFEHFPISTDVYFDFQNLDQKFLEELKKEYFEETWKKIINEKTNWGHKQKYIKLMSYQSKIIDSSLLDLPSKFKSLAKQIFKYILQYSEDRKTKFSKSTQLTKLLNILLDENNFCFLQDEIYLQIMKQLSNNPNKNSIYHLLNLLSIISSLIPPSSNILLSILNFLYIKSLLNNESNEELANKCKYIFLRISKIFEVGARKNHPMEIEIMCIESNKQYMYPIFFLTGEHALINCESYTTIKEVKEIIMDRFKININRFHNLGLFFIVKISKDKGFITSEEGYIEDKNKIMDVLAKWDNIRKLNLKSDFSFQAKIFLKIRVNFEYNDQNTKDEIVLLYVQSVYEFLNDKYFLNEKEILNLAAIKMAVDFGDFSEEKVRFLKMNIYDYIPFNKIENYPPQGWIDRILVNYLALKTYSKTQARQLFLNNLKKYEQFNAQLYFVKLNISEGEIANINKKIESSFSVYKILIWKSNQLLIASEESNKIKIEETITYSLITGWGKLEKKGVYFIKENATRKVYNVICEKYKELEFLLRLNSKNFIQP